MKKQTILISCILLIVLTLIILLFENRSIKTNENGNENILDSNPETGVRPQTKEASYFDERSGYGFVYPERLDIVSLEGGNSVGGRFSGVGLFSGKYGGEPGFKVLSFDQKEISLEDFAKKYKENLKSNDSLEGFVISSGQSAYKLDPDMRGGGEAYVFLENRNKEKIVIVYTFKNTIYEEIIKDFYLSE